jgi:hypothetical protein
MSRLALLPILLLTATQAFATTTMLIVTDQPKAAKAQEVAALFRTTKPYSLMKDLKLKVIQTSAAKLGCQAAPISAADVVATNESDQETLLARSEWRDRESRAKNFDLPRSCSNKDAPISRLISCDTPQANRYLAALQKTERAQAIIVVKTDSRYGGSGGSRPVITTGSPAAMAIHELMHQLGFADEYAYTNACEADIYCDENAGDFKSPSGYGALPGTSFNVAAFNARTTYSSNADVRKTHGRDIPWLSFISASTDLVTAGRLGSPAKAGEIGLYRAVVCDKASDRHDTWLSTSDATIMKTLGTTYIPKDYWNTIAKSLGTHITN